MHRIARSSSLTLLGVTAGLLLLATPGALRAQDGPAQSAQDDADAAGAPNSGPSSLNTVQQARMKLAGAKRSVAHAEKFEAKSVAATDETEKKAEHDKAQAAYKDAIVAYQEAIKLDPRLIEAWNGFAALLIKGGRPDLAVKSYDHALAIAPKNADALSGKAHAELVAFKVADAEATYDQLTKVSRKAARRLISDMRVWLDAERPHLAPEMAQAAADLDAWISARETK